MALNDPQLSAGKGIGMYPGVANPTSAGNNNDAYQSNFVTDPTTDDLGAGAGPTFQGHNQAARTFKESSGVVEGRPGIIETTNIDPLNENSNKDDGWANATRNPGPTGTSSNLMSSAAEAARGAANLAGGVANLAYGTVTGDQASKQAGNETLFGK
ncbi:hypothetical protein BC834DRAFT_830867 [Gloeopeniophorella convolvens]|nr:hypothetical protein BC834DRAFT_830867 [Gloeopeniophorella convolvens]